MIKAVLFDMDGVLIDARDWHYDALNDALSLFGFEISRDEHLAFFDGLPTREKLEILNKSRGFPKNLNSLTNSIKQQRTFELAVQNATPKFAIQSVLALAKSQEFKVAVCSNSIRSTIEVMLERSGLASHVDLMVSNEDVDNSKPHPEMYQFAMSEFGVLPEDCLIVEDSEHGIAAARAAKAHIWIVGSPDDVTPSNFSKEIRRVSQ